MGNNSRGSEKTLLFSVILGVLGAASESKADRGLDELTEARKALDSALLEKGAKPTDAKVKAKAALVEEKLKEFRESYSETMTPLKGPTSYRNVSPDLPNGERDEKDGTPVRAAEALNSTAPAKAIAPVNPVPAATPEIVLSSEGIQSEVIYPKKGKKPTSPAPAIESATGPITGPSPGAGLSEIQYEKPKKKGPRRGRED